MLDCFLLYLHAQVSYQLVQNFGFGVQVHIFRKLEFPEIINGHHHINQQATSQITVQGYK